MTHYDQQYQVLLTAIRRALMADTSSCSSEMRFRGLRLALHKAMEDTAYDSPAMCAHVNESPRDVCSCNRRCSCQRFMCGARAKLCRQLGLLMPVSDRTVYARALATLADHKQPDAPRWRAGRLKRDLIITGGAGSSRTFPALRPLTVHVDGTVNIGGVVLRNVDPDLIEYPDDAAV